MKTLFKHCNTVSQPATKTDKKNEDRLKFTGVKMDKSLFKKAKRRAGKLHQSYSDYVRQLIVRDIEPAGK